MLFGPDFAMWRDVVFGIGAALLMIWCVVGVVAVWLDRWRNWRENRRDK